MNPIYTKKKKKCIPLLLYIRRIPIPISSEVEHFHVVLDKRSTWVRHVKFKRKNLQKSTSITSRYSEIENSFSRENYKLQISIKTYLGLHNPILASLTLRFMSSAPCTHFEITRVEPVNQDAVKNITENFTLNQGLTLSLLFPNLRPAHFPIL